jgi:hypothetical protein
LLKKMIFSHRHFGHFTVNLPHVNLPYIDLASSATGGHRGLPSGRRVNEGAGSRHGHDRQSQRSTGSRGNSVKPFIEPRRRNAEIGKFTERRAKRSASIRRIAGSLANVSISSAGNMWPMYCQAWSVKWW